MSRARALVAAVVLGSSWNTALSTTVDIVQGPAGHWQIRRDEKPFAVHGAGGWHNLPLAASLGVNTLRTWGVEDLLVNVDGKPLVDRAHELGLVIVAGLWLQHERQGMDYADADRLLAQRERIRQEVRRFRGHPAIILWDLGNEMEGPTSPSGPERIWREVEVLARLVKAEDPTRPVMTTIAGASKEKIEAVRRYCPSLDLLGLNLYGGAHAVVTQLDLGGWTRPFMLTEFGPLGPWEVRQTAWGAPIEPDTRTKVANYLRAHATAVSDPKGRCLGTFPFFWGQKQETTSTWFGMFLPTGEKTPMVDGMGQLYSGQRPPNSSPVTEPLHPNFANGSGRPGEEHTVEVIASDADADPLTYEWMVQDESRDRKVGGDDESIPPIHPECIVRISGPKAVLRLPVRPGAYRLFVYVRDGKGGGCSENVPFYVQP